MTCRGLKMDWRRRGRGGVQSPQLMTKELGISTVSHGSVLACFFAFTALGLPVSTRLAERLGATPSLAVAATVAGATLVGLGFTALSATAGPANSLVQSATGLSCTRMSPRRLSLASGLMQAASGIMRVITMASFFVPVGMMSGFWAATAGLLALTAGGLAATVRIGVGACADRQPQANILVVVCMMFAGTGGLLSVCAKS